MLSQQPAQRRHPVHAKPSRVNDMLAWLEKHGPAMAERKSYELTFNVAGRSVRGEMRMDYQGLDGIREFLNSHQAQLDAREKYQLTFSVGEQGVRASMRMFYGISEDA